jgi:hypothetical protein
MLFKLYGNSPGRNGRQHTEPNWRWDADCNFFSVISWLECQEASRSKDLWPRLRWEGIDQRVGARDGQEVVLTTWLHAWIGCCTMTKKNQQLVSPSSECTYASDVASSVINKVLEIHLCHNLNALPSSSTHFRGIRYMHELRLCQQ